jgi:A/G-specific adenine glycosylase
MESLAAASDEEILEEWAGLGYYARARNLISCAREIAKRGAFPRTSGELRKLPGIGSYTAPAIAAIAFGEKAAAVDTNITRVLSRLHGLRQPSRETIEALLLDMLPCGGPGDLIQAMMDLGATICRPRNPICGECPVADECTAFMSKDPEGFPERPKRRARPHKQGFAYWTRRGDRVWLVRRPTEGLLGGMAALPGSEWSEDKLPRCEVIGVIRHVFTHFSLDLHIVRRSEPEGEGWWHSLDELDRAGLPTLYRKAVQSALSAG